MYKKFAPQYYVLNADKGGVESGPRATACAFWNEFLRKLQGNEGKWPAEGGRCFFEKFLFAEGKCEPCGASIIGTPGSSATIHISCLTLLIHFVSFLGIF